MEQSRKANFDYFVREILLAKESMNEAASKLESLPLEQSYCPQIDEAFEDLMTFDCILYEFSDAFIDFILQNLDHISIN